MLTSLFSNESPERESFRGNFGRTCSALIPAPARWRPGHDCPGLPQRAAGPGRAGDSGQEAGARPGARGEGTRVPVIQPRPPPWTSGRPAALRSDARRAELGASLELRRGCRELGFQALDRARRGHAWGHGVTTQHVCAPARRSLHPPSGPPCGCELPYVPASQAGPTRRAPQGTHLLRRPSLLLCQLCPPRCADPGAHRRPPTWPPRSPTVALPPGHRLAQQLLFYLFLNPHPRTFSIDF